MKVDREERVVAIPGELGAALADDPAASAAFDALATSHRREYADGIGQAKKPATRTARARKAIAMINERRNAGASPVT